MHSRLKWMKKVILKLGHVGQELSVKLGSISHSSLHSCRRRYRIGWKLHALINHSLQRGRMVNCRPGFIGLHQKSLKLMLYQQNVSEIATCADMLSSFKCLMLYLNKCFRYIQCISSEIVRPSTIKDSPKLWLRVSCIM